MAKTKVLIAVKTYPTLSGTYDELVCTAGFREDGSWIRIYPVPFRKLAEDSQYKKWQWITIDLKRREKDFRPETYSPVNIDSDIELGETISTGKKGDWAVRKHIVFRNRVYTNMDELVSDALNPTKYTSLAVFKPTKIIDFIYEPVEREWDKEKLQQVYANQLQQNLFDNKDATKFFQVVEKLPYKFSYKFLSAEGKTHTLMIEDWELGMLYRRSLLSAQGDETKACELVKQKYLYDMTSEKKDFYFFLGTTLQYHAMRAANPFIIIGTFYPPRPDGQTELQF